MDQILPIRFSVIVPVYNSSQSLAELFQRTQDTFLALKQGFEVIFVEDCSADNSWEVIQRLKALHSDSITAIRLAKNFGQHNAIFCGLQFIQGDFVITLDDDLQIPPEEITQLIRKQEETGADLVYGDLIKKNHSMLRRVGSQVLKDSAKKRDQDATGKGSSFKLFTADLAKKIRSHSQSFIYIDEMLIWYTRFISFTPVRHEPRKYQSSNYSLFKLFRLFVNLTIHYTVIPLKLMTYGGMLLSTLSFFAGLWFIYRWLFFNVPLGYTSLIVATTFSSSIILLSLGIIGEYLNRMFVLQNRKPPYSIKEVYPRNFSGENP